MTTQQRLESALLTLVLFLATCLLFVGMAYKDSLDERDRTCEAGWLAVQTVEQEALFVRATPWCAR